MAILTGVSVLACACEHISNESAPGRFETNYSDGYIEYV